MRGGLCGGFEPYLRSKTFKPSYLLRLIFVHVSTDLWVSAYIRTIEAQGGYAYVTQKGDLRGGSVILKLINLETRAVTLLRRIHDQEEGVWIRPIKSEDEREIDAYIDKQKRFDRDLWVIEVEDRQGRAFLTEKIDLS